MRRECLLFAKHMFTQKGRQDTDLPGLGFRFSGLSSELKRLELSNNKNHKKQLLNYGSRL